MKHLIKLLLGLSILATSISACKKDDDSTKKKNYLKIGNTEYELSAGAIENYGQDGYGISTWQYDGCNIDLTLISEGINLATDEYGEMGISGTGQLLFFEMFTSSPASLDNEEYHFDSISPFPIHTFDYGVYATNWVEDSKGNDWVILSTGKVTIRKNENEYDISINCTDEKGNNVTGNYSGLLKYFDYDKKMKSSGVLPKKSRR